MKVAVQEHPDVLLGGRLVLHQGAAGDRISTDTLLLAAAITAHPGERLLELGSGTGGAALCVAARAAGCAVTGLEKHRALVAMAQQNAQLNGVADRVRFVVGDVLRPPADVADGGYDQVFANPPYLEARRADLRAAEKARTARIEGDAGLDRWLGLMLGAVREKGRVTLIHRADRLDDVLAGLSGVAGEIAICPLWPRRGVAAKRVIVTARRGVRAPLKLCSGVVLHENDGTFRAPVERLLCGGSESDLWAGSA